MVRRVLLPALIALACASPATASLELGRGYRVVPLTAPRNATLVASLVEPQPTNPHPGPSLRVELVRRGVFHERSLAVRIEPTRG